VGAAMKVKIDHGQKTTGMIRKKTYETITVKVDLSHEELAVIKSRKMDKIVVMERGWPAHMGAMNGDFNLTVGGLVKNLMTEYSVNTPIEAKQYEAALVNQLKLLKEELVGNASGGESKSFEL
jgi:hypothetical protein